MNPFAKATDHKVETAKEDTEADKDVFFDKKGKLIVKDLEREKEMSMMERKQKKERRELDLNEGLIQPGTAGMKMLKTKRVHNVAKDKYNFSDDEEGDYSKTKKKKEGGNKSRKIKDSHFVKFSGEEYKNKSGKGDKLLQGKYDPFTYIQLNPKSTSKKNRGDTLKMFKNLMHPSDK